VNTNESQKHAIGCWPDPPTYKLASGRTINQADYNAQRDGAIESSYSPRHDDATVREWLASLDQPALPNKDPKRNSDGSLISVVGVR
jgi:hypothetical protein